MKLDICIVEDSKIDSKILKVILESYFEEHHIVYTIKIYSTGLAFYADYKEGFISPTTLFMDVFLPKTNGLDICKKMRESGYSGDILITTETKDHAIEAISVDARGYILKPYNAPDVYEILDKICKYASIRTFTVKTRQRVVRIPVSDILYVESIEANCVIHCVDNIIYTVHRKLDSIETELNDKHFLRCHKSYLVNMDHVVSVENDFELYDGSHVPVRKAEIKSFKDAYTEFLEERY